MSKMDKIGNYRFIGQTGQEFKRIVAKPVKKLRQTGLILPSRPAADDETCRQRFLAPATPSCDRGAGFWVSYSTEKGMLLDFATVITR
jgi:hypothetical protein